MLILLGLDTHTHTHSNSVRCMCAHTRKLNLLTSFCSLNNLMWKKRQKKSGIIIYRGAFPVICLPFSALQSFFNVSSFNLEALGKRKKKTGRSYEEQNFIFHFAKSFAQVGCYGNIYSFTVKNSLTVFSVRWVYVFLPCIVVSCLGIYCHLVRRSSFVLHCVLFFLFIYLLFRYIILSTAFIWVEIVPFFPGAANFELQKCS